MALTAEQRKILAKIKTIGRQVGASPKEIKAAIETGLVESNLRNLGHGDADSQGWRQERASLYKDPTNLDASIRRFFSETRAVRDKYASAGELAAAVQRPAAQYRGRYQQMSKRADQLMGAATSTIPGVSPPPSAAVTPTGDTRQQLLGQYLTQRGRPGALAALGSGLSDLQSPAAPMAPSTPSSPASAPAGSANILELFWQGPGGINVKDGKRVPQGFVSGHDRHVHVAAPTEKGVLKLAALAQQMGLKVGEHPKFGGVAPVHVKNSNHYSNRAIDVTGDPAKLKAFAHRIAAMAR